MKHIIFKIATAAFLLCFSIGFLVPNASASSSFTMDDYIRAVLYNQPLPSQTQAYIPLASPQNTQPSPQVSPGAPSAPPPAQPTVPDNYSLNQSVKIPNDYYNAILNHRTTPIYYGNTPAPPAVNPTPPPGQETPEDQSVPPQPPAPAGLSASEAGLYELINSARSGEGIRPVEIDMRIVEVARLKARDMIENNYFGHSSPTYGSPGQMLRKFGINFRSAGENLCKAGDVYKAHMLLLNSAKGHREIMLDPDYTKVGVAVVPQGSYVLIAELFVEP